MSVSTQVPAVKENGTAKATTAKAQPKAEAKAQATEEQKEIQRLKAELKAIKESAKINPQSLEEKILYFQEKQKMVNSLNTLNAYVENLLLVADEIAQKPKDEDFTNEGYQIKVIQKPAYGAEKEILKIKNLSLIGEVLSFAINKIEVKRQDLIKKIEM